MFVLLACGVALAHIGLEDPRPRYASDGLDGKNKACPGGVGDSDRLCDDPTDRSDPDRNRTAPAPLHPGRRSRWSSTR